ncbi:MAG: fimbrillin family protein [Alistipes sp.]
MKTGLLFTWAAAAAMLAGCSQESVVDSSVNKMENAIGFSTYKNVSRGNPVNDNAEFMTSGNQFGVTAFINNTTTSPYMGTATAGIPIKADGTQWNYANPADLAYWPTKGETLDFYGYAPFGTTAITALAFDKANGMSFTYTVPATEAEQQDVMFALDPTKAKPATPGERVKMPFKHALTQVHFRIGTKTTNLKVDVAANGITINKLKNTGEFKLSAAGIESWTLPTTAGTAVYTVTSAAVTEAGYIGTSAPFNYQVVGTADKALMLLPQEFKAKTATETAGAFLTISCKIYQEGATPTEKTYLVGDATTFGTVEVPISSQREATEVWKRNKKVTYNILIGEGGTLEPILFAADVETWVSEDGGTVEN